MNVTSVKRIHQSDWTSSGVRFLRARDIVAAFKNEEPSDYLYISEEKYNEYSSLSGKVKIGDLLVTGVGTILALCWPVGLIIAAIWGTVTYLSKYVSLGSVIAISMAPVLMTIFDQNVYYICFAAIASCATS